MSDGTAAAYSLERAWVDGAVRDDVLVEVADGRFTAVTWASGGGEDPRAAGDPDAGAPTRLRGLTVPGLANCHSHAFHRALRGRTQRERGTFWTWREQMYAVAGRLDPELYFRLARAAYREMAAAGITSVGEFHYLHHRPDGGEYDDPNAMGHALVAAGAEAGVRVVLLDTCYLSSGFGAPPEGVQVRYSDGDAVRWAERVADLEAPYAGAAIHSVRAVPREQLATVVEAAAGRPLHVHLSEQVAENEACLAAHGLTPTELLAEAGALGPRTSAVHATHLTDGDVSLLGGAAAYSCFCPTTERDLADGIGPARALLDAGAPLSLGSDQHAVIDLLEEARAMEMHERLVSLQRGRFRPAELLGAATAHASLGWPDAGRLEAGARADLVAVRLDSPRTAGSDPAQVVLAATASDVDTVVVDGRVVVTGGRHRLGDVGALLRDAIQPLWEDA